MPFAVSNMKYITASRRTAALMKAERRRRHTHSKKNKKKGGKKSARKTKEEGTWPSPALLVQQQPIGGAEIGPLASRVVSRGGRISKIGPGVSRGTAPCYQHPAAAPGRGTSRRVQPCVKERLLLVAIRHQDDAVGSESGFSPLSIIKSSKVTSNPFPVLLRSSFCKWFFFSDSSGLFAPPLPNGWLSSLRIHSIVGYGSVRLASLDNWWIESQVSLRQVEQHDECRVYSLMSGLITTGNCGR